MLPRAAEVATVLGALVERSHVVDKRRRRGFVEAIEEIEAFCDEFQAELLTDRHELRQAQVQRHVTMRDAEVATETAARKLAIRDQRRTTHGAGYAERSVGEHSRSIRLVRLVVVSVLIAQNVEWTSGRDLEDRRDR